MQIALTSVKNSYRITTGHNILLNEKIKDLNIHICYIEQCIESQWTRQVLESQLNQLYKRQGKAVINFQNTLPSEVSALAQKTIKYPYIFDFLRLDTLNHGRDIQNQLVQHVSKFLSELDKGFAFVGQ
ncbi:PDDEXK nuclease domain-containing protein [Sphingobacterium kitahiroshimense]|uniref:PDDEXK nuclease domain-containing protein n=1 Tax=Sphingobacterium kitahiroshimense TaxID=470446 RepID=A0ABV0BSH8_9SPHI